MKRWKVAVKPQTFEVVAPTKAAAERIAQDREMKLKAKPK